MIIKQRGVEKTLVPLFGKLINDDFIILLFNDFNRTTDIGLIEEPFSPKTMYLVCTRQVIVSSKHDTNYTVNVVCKRRHRNSMTFCGKQRSSWTVFTAPPVLISYL